MQLNPTERARLLVFQAAELARRTRERGLKLNAPEAVALACDEMHMAARAGGSMDEVLAAGRASLAPEDLIDGVAELVGEIRLEVLMGDGTRLIVLRGLGARGGPEAGGGPGAVATSGARVVLNAGLATFEIDVANTSDHPVRVSSHFPFDRVNARLSFDREAARGARLDVPAGDTVRWGPGERRTVRLVRIGEDDA